MVGMTRRLAAIALANVAILAALLASAPVHAFGVGS